ncbi:cytochrome d ubiquinol oxidase subunit II [Bradyrhizobium liaoningense]|uniref:cytochrome d ubiquinol oxidase subunit II n=1 Tax=Bradyrhizobium liaoningense TaxID=43992 RepID=UPI0028A1915D|nr:cytochrome d ubiquinol oxidase subunit II [Bradyrhizobium liaoningense]
MVNFWASLLAISVLIYLILDGFDLGVGMLFGLVKSERRRDAVLATISPVWDGNETWLVVAGVITWGAFPLAYSMLLSAFYIPVLVMLLGLVLRGVAFEFRSKSLASKWVWNVSFVVGSFAASFMQGTMVGAMVHGLHFVDRVYSGGPAGWFTPVLRPMRRRLVPWLLPAWCELAGGKERGRDPSFGTGADSAACNWSYCISRGYICVLSGRAASHFTSLARPTVSVRLSFGRFRRAASGRPFCAN